eukprot:scaffold5376_cov48-Phaeocystis_antarctica.AAC.1
MPWEAVGWARCEPGQLRDQKTLCSRRKYQRRNQLGDKYELTTAECGSVRAGSERLLRQRLLHRRRRRNLGLSSALPRPTCAPPVQRVACSTCTAPLTAPLTAPSR